MDRWSQLSMSEKSDLMSLYIRNGIRSLEEIKKHYNSYQVGGPVSEKTPNFVQRFNEGNKRDIPFQGGHATHLLSYAERDGKYYVYPEVQPTDYNNSNSPLQYYGRDWRVAFDRAYDNNDYLEFDTEEAARNYSENYKKVPSTGAVLNGRNRGNYNILDYMRGFATGGQMNTDGPDDPEEDKIYAARPLKEVQIFGQRNPVQADILQQHLDNVNSFYYNDVVPRLQREHQGLKTKADINFPYLNIEDIDFNPIWLGKGKAAAYVNQIFPSKIHSYETPEVRHFDEDMAHENSHRWQFEYPKRDKQYEDKSKEMLRQAYGNYTNKFRNTYKSLPAFTVFGPNRNLINIEYEADNRAVRYNIWRDYRDLYHRTPTIEELDKYIDEIPALDLYKKYIKPSGYLDVYSKPPAKKDERYRDFYKSEMEDFEENVQKVREALKHVAQNDTTEDTVHYAALGGHLYQDGGPDGSKEDKNNKGHVTFGTYDEYGNIIPMYHLNQVNVGATQPYRTPEQEAQVTRERNMYFDAMRHFNYGNQNAEGLKETYAKYPELRSYLKRIGMSENDFMSAATGRDYETNSYERERTRQFNKDIQKAETDRANTFMQAVQHQNPNDQKLAAIMTGILGGVTGTGILSGAGLLDGVVSGASKVLTNPIVDAGLTVHGAITAPNNIKEGISELQEGRYGAGALDLGMTALDLLGAGQLVTRTGRMLSPAYRAKHAYNAVAPVGYQGVKDKAKSWLRDMWYNEPVNLKNPKWYREGKDNPGSITGNLQGIDNSDVRLGVTGTADYITPGTKNADRIADEARLDAWAIYNGLEPQYGTYIKNADGTYSYDLARIRRISNDTWNPAYTPDNIPSNIKLSAGNGQDFVTGAGGGLTDFRILGTDTHGNGIMRIEDVWDLHPFSRSSDVLSKRIQKKLFPNWEEKFANPMFEKAARVLDWGLSHNSKRIANLGNKMFDASDKPLFGLLEKIDDKMKNFEVGKLTGGKPFKMSTNIKYHLEDPLLSRLETDELGNISFDSGKRVLHYGFTPDYIANIKPIEKDLYNAYDLGILKDMLKNITKEK